MHVCKTSIRSSNFAVSSYLRIGCNYQDFAYRSELLTTRFTYRQGYIYQKPCSTYNTLAHRRIPLLSALPYLLFNTAWRMQLPYTHTAFSTPIHACACTYLHKDNTLRSLRSSDPDQTKDSFTKRRYFRRAATDLLDKARYLTTFCAWNSSPHLPVTPCSAADEA